MTIHKKNGVSIRIAENNPNHHLYLNNGCWCVHYTIHPTPFTSRRMRRSLTTRKVAVARRRRDALFARLGLAAQALSGSPLN